MHKTIEVFWNRVFTSTGSIAKSLQSCPTLGNPADSSPPGSPIPGILQARTPEWVAISFSVHESEKWKWSHSVVSDSLPPHGLQPTRLLHPWDLPGKSTGVGCHCLLCQVVLGFFNLMFTAKIRTVMDNADLFFFIWVHNDTVKKQSERAEDQMCMS